MIDIGSVSRENFDDSDLGRAYEIGMKMSDTEIEILRLIKGVFREIPDVPMRNLNPNDLQTKLLSKFATVQSQSITLFQTVRDDVFGLLNRSVENGFEVGKRSGANQIGADIPKTRLTETEQGKETVKQANGSLLKAMAFAVMGAVSGITSAIAFLSSSMKNADMTFREAYDRFVVPRFEQGLPGKTAVNGRQISLVSYCETVAREGSQQALLLGESVAAKDSENYLVQISAHYACCPLCEPWQNAILIDDVWADGKPDGVHKLLSEAVRSGLFHINCRHLKRIYIPGKTVASNPPNYDPEKVAVNYELEQMQRRLEREIRNKKRVLEMSLTQDERAKAETAVRNKQAQLRGLVRFADKNGYKVYRQNWKEEITFEKSPTVPYSFQNGKRETLTKSAENATIEIRRNQTMGRAVAIRLSNADLNKRQKLLLSKLEKSGDFYIANKRQIKTKDIAALTAHQEVEFALFSNGNRRLIVRGGDYVTEFSKDFINNLVESGWKFSAHTHPTVGPWSMMPSQQDIDMLYIFKQGQSVIYNAIGNFEKFYKE